MPEPTTAGAREKREQEFLEAEADRFGWDHYHVEDAVSFARMFRAERDEARAALAQAERERDRYRAAIQQMVAQKSLLMPRIWQIGEDALAAAPPPEEEASRE